MKFDKAAARDQLDLAASELENAGFADLAEKVDYYNYRMMKATASEIPLIKRAISRIQQEATRRFRLTKPKSSVRVSKATAATQNARRATAARKETLKRRLKTIVANRKKAAERLEALRNSRETRRSSKSTRRYSRKKRIATNSR